MKSRLATKNQGALKFLLKSSTRLAESIRILRKTCRSKLFPAASREPQRPSFSSTFKSISFHRSTTMLLISLMIAAALLAHGRAEAASTPTRSDSSESHPQAALNYLLFASSAPAGAQPVSSSHLAAPDLAAETRLATLLRDTNHSHASDAVDLRLANLAWLRLHQNAEEFARQRVALSRPIVGRLLDQANVSAACKRSVEHTLERLERLDDWAVRMYNSFGDFLPSGFFEGTHTSMGDYHQCVNLEPNQWIGEPQYCTFKYQPVVPRRPRYHNILAKIGNLANFTRKEDMFNGLAGKAHYFYYTKLRLATCMPSKCEKTDLERLGEQIAVNTYLQFQGVGCLEKSKGFNPDGAQIFALAVLVSLASVSFLGTLVHLVDLKSLFVVGRADDAASTSSTTKSTDLTDAAGSEFRDGNHVALLQRPQQQQQQQQQQQLQQQQQPLHPNQCKGSILPTPVIQQRRPRQAARYGSRAAQRAVRLINFLVHFSMIRNGRKLFDTTTSRKEVSSSSRPGHTLVAKRNDLAKMKAPAGLMADGGGGGPMPISVSDGTDDHDDVGGANSRELNTASQSNDISCVHGLRFWTISWIILGHTMQYTEWAGFGRAYQIEQNITSFLLHPLLNATFSVDTFFLISGLLTTYVTWTITRGQYWRFNKFAFLISRYLRLTPQVLLVMLLFIVFPLMGDGPYWGGLIQKESDNCKKNWWVGALYLQSFYRSNQICNLVTWWLSIEMFYHFVSIIVIIALLHSARKGILAALIVGGAMTGVSCYLHYANHYPPNMLPTLLQRYEIWDSIVLKYFWTPYPHAPAYFTGLLLGYALYNRSISQLSRNQVRLGWLAFVICYLSILFGTYQWNKNAPYSRAIATIYYNVSQVLWSFATAWAILACALGNGGWLNSFLSSPVFVPLGRATYMTYLSHMLIVMAYPAKMNLLIEPSYTVFLYIFISNLFLSYALGIMLTLVYESPILHLQKMLVGYMAVKYNDEKNPDGPPKEAKSPDGGGGGGGDQKFVRVALYEAQ